MASLMLLFLLYIIAGAFETRVLYLMLHVEGAMLSVVFMLYVSVLTYAWWLLILVVMSVIGAAVGLSLVIKYARSVGSDYVNSI